MERKGIVTMKGNPLTLLGNEIKEGHKAPYFITLDKDLREVDSRGFSGKKIVISVTPSLDTPVCDLQLKRFNKDASEFDNETIVLNISVDLPFAIARFCNSNGIDRVLTLSDYRDVDFGTKFGVLIKENRLLARSVFIIDKTGMVSYKEIVPDITQHPNYERAISELKKLK
ncbi:MAG: thiol peroxidase [Deltaproteobacteria bacterium]|nr:thiol peroxidase [Deltaproteobacteria bacterium]